MPLPIPPGRLPKRLGVRDATGPLPPAASQPEPVTVQRLVNANGRVLVAGHYLPVGSLHSGKTVNVIVEDTHFRIVHDGEELTVHPRTTDKPVTRFKAWPSRQSRMPPQARPDDRPSSES